MKNKSLATVLAFLLGTFGAHRFYLGQNKFGWFYLGFCWALLPTLIGLIDGIVFLCMSYADFNRKYSLRHVFKKKYQDDDDILDFNMNEKLEDELLAKLMEINDSEKVKVFLKDAKENGHYLPRKVYNEALKKIAGDTNIYEKTLDIQ